jgi:2,4-dienoyl-CoA reductase-like NADH-dependent reductase (Old Yellow Enzyme family)
LITGNVMIDRQHCAEPGNVVLEDQRDLRAFKTWAAAAGEDGTLWMQLNHPGRQAPAFADRNPVAPSAVPFGPPGIFAPPRALEGREIEEIVSRFANSAALAKAAGFSGVQLHGAHGYLVGQFLSPLTNLRTDAWGGDARKRRRFALSIISAIRAQVGSSFPVSIKLNSADFQRGGFSENEAVDVLNALEAEGIDLIELSGGTYETPVMMGSRGLKTREREAYFLAFAERARQRVQGPLMLTGGFRSAAGMAGAVANGAVDIVGLARPMALVPDLPAKLLAGEVAGYQPPELLAVGFGGLDGYLEVTWHLQQLQRMARGLEPDPQRPAWLAAAVALIDNGFGLWSVKRG